MSILIGADIVPTTSNVELFNSGDTASLLGEGLRSVLSAADYRIFNLEVPLTDTESPIDKQGPKLIAPTSTVNGYRALGIDLLTLANNHILDQGNQGLQSTIKALDEAGIKHLGADSTLREAAKPFVFAFYGKKIGVYACAEHEFSIAGEESAGANPFDPLWALDHVENLKKNVDYVIVLYHGGKEHYHYPSPELQKICRRLVDKGADLVVCQHSHCIGCEEKYGSGVIVYGQGNFLFDHKDYEEWQTGLLLKIDENLLVSYIPFVKSGNCVRLADKNKSNEIITAFYHRSEEIKEPGFISKQYSQLAQTMLNKYLYALSGKEIVIFRVINKLSGGRLRRYMLRRKYGKTQLIAVRNYVECEAHRELLVRGILKAVDLR